MQLKPTVFHSVSSGMERAAERRFDAPLVRHRRIGRRWRTCGLWVYQTPERLRVARSATPFNLRGAAELRPGGYEREF
jgi:hypothetical protein